MIKYAMLIAAAGLSLATTGCAGGMKASPVRGDFETASGSAYRATPPQAPAPDSMNTAARDQRSMEIGVESTKVQSMGGDGIDDEGDGRLADNSPSPSGPPPRPAPAPAPAPAAPSLAARGGGAIGLALGATGPQPKKAANAGPTPPPLPPPPPGSPTTPGQKPPPPPQEAQNKQQLLVYTANLQMAVYLVEPGLASVEKIAKDFGGYLSSRGDNKIEIRVPRERFNEALKAVEATGDVLHRDVQASDVTDQYVDMESRLRNAKVIRARLQALLERAQVKEALEIERELGRVTQEIEVLEGKLKLLRDKVAFSTITVQYAPKAQALQKTAFALPFPWLSQLGLPNLLRLRDHKGDD